MGSHDPSDQNRYVAFRPSKVTVDQGTPNRLHVGMRQGMEFVNGLPYHIRVCTRQGIIYTIAPDLRAQSREFRISLLQEWSTRTEHDTSQLETLTSPVEKAIADSMLINLGGMMGSTKMGCITTSITASDFEINGGTLYLESLDILVSTRPGSLVHPHSPLGRDLALIRDTQGAAHEDAASFIIRIVDNARKVGHLFINLNGDVFRVPARVDTSMEDGIYVIKSGVSEGDFEPQAPTVIYYGFEEGKEKLKLFNTVREAKVMGDVDANLDADYKMRLAEVRNEELRLKGIVAENNIELETVKHRVKQLELELDDEKRKGEMAKLRYEEDLRRQKAELDTLNHQLNMRSMTRKDYYEERSADRKDQSEILKWLPTIIVAAGAIILGLRKSS